MQLASSHNMNHYYYCENWLVHASIDNATKDFKIEEPKPKGQEPKASNSSLRFNQDGNTKTSNKAWKEKKKR